MFDEITCNNRHGAEAVTKTDDDGRILVLFREWVSARRAWSAVCAEVYDKLGPTADDKAKAQAALQVVEAIEGEIAATSPAGAAGLAVKVYLLIHDLDDWARDDSAALSSRTMAGAAMQRRSPGTWHTSCPSSRR